MENRLRLCFFTVLLASLVGTSAFAQGEREGRRLVFEGNEAFKKGDYTTADSLYRSGMEAGAPQTAGSFNLGNTAYRQEDYEAAITEFERAARSAKDPSNQADAWYNAGNTYLAQQDPQKALDAYKQALRLNPDDEDARHNLMLAKQMLEQAENQEQQDGDQDQNNEEQQENQDQQEGDKDEQDGNQPQDQEGQDQENQEQEGQDSQPKESNEEGEEKPAQSAPQAGQISKEDAERMLEALNKREKELQQQLLKKKNDGKSKNIEKDW